MLSLIEVKCPHCGAKGQIMVPPPGAIIVAPCPDCQELVVVFCGQVLALRKETMLNSSIREKREHLLSVLTDFLRQRVVEIISDEEGTPIEKPVEKPVPEKAHAQEAEDDPPMAMQHWTKPVSKRLPISQEELEHFRHDELRLIDNPDYFKAIFG